MKKTIKFLAMILSLSAVTFFTACDPGEEDTVDDLINNGPDLADGYYIVGSAVSADTTVANSLVQGQVNAPDFGKQDRPGFFEAYVYMTSGSFSFIKVEGDEITELGGSTTEETDGDPVQIAIHVGALTAGGTGQSPVNGKLCHVTVDETTGEFLIIPIDFWEIIGDATEDGWGAGQQISQKSASAEAVVFEATGVTLRGPGSYKFRYNGNWSMPRVEGCDAAVEACYNFFTNFGGTLESLVHGGSNLSLGDEDGVYTVTISYAPAAGRSMSASITRTGDAEELTFDPADYPWGIIGEATATGWDADTDLTYLDWAGTWTGIYYLNTGKFKFRTDEGWSNEISPNNSVLDGGESIGTDGGDFTNSAAGLFFVRISTSDEGTTWNLHVKPVSPGVIGAAVANGWDGPDNNMDFVSEVEGTITWKVSGLAFAADDWKIRLNDGWEINFGFGVTLSGANAGLLSDSSGNFRVSTAGNYDVTLTTSDNGATWAVAFD